MNHIGEVISALDAIANTRMVWQRGLMHPGGPHRRLAGSVSPISIGEDECALFGKLIAALTPKNCFIVGNAFGFSSAYIARAMLDHGGKSVVTLDAESEGDGARCAQIARALTDRLDLGILTNKKGWSPRDIPQAVEDSDYDIIFIDGCHGHPAVCEDLQGTAPYAREDTLFVWHDYWFPGVRHGVDEAIRQGYRCWWVPTSCEMVLGTKSNALFTELKAMLPNGDADPARHWSLPRYALRWWAKSMPVYAHVLGERMGGVQPVRELPSST
jgi:predicted O-methyltransferase YrrM